MASSRRTFIRQVIAMGPVAMTIWLEPDTLWGKECAKSDEHQDCTLPNPPQATRFIPREPKVRYRYSAAEMAQPAHAAQLQAFRNAICMVRDLPPTDVISWTKLVAQHCTQCAPANKNNVHYDWQFPTWHRCLLYFLERQLRIMSKNDAGNQRGGRRRAKRDARRGLTPLAGGRLSATSPASRASLTIRASTDRARPRSNRTCRVAEHSRLSRPWQRARSHLSSARPTSSSR